MRIITGKTNGEILTSWIFQNYFLIALKFFYVIIIMKCFLHFFRAIKKFTAGIKVDPTYVRAYVCRGEAYHKIHDVSTEVMQQLCSNLLKNYDLCVWTLQLYFHMLFFFIKFQLRAALKDFTRAIHLRPDVHHYYMYRVNILWYIKFR